MTAISEHPFTPPPGARAGEVDPVRALCHDLRQPLAAVLLLAQNPVRGTGDARRRLALIAEQAAWIATVVDQVLLEAPGQHVTSVDVAACASAAANRAGATATRPISVRASGPVIAWAREVALTRALGCLIDNAVRAAGPGAVAVDIVGADGRVEVLVTDTGPGLGGVPEQTSLGLAITRALLATCGGSFTLRNGPSGGAVARVILSAVER